MKKIGLNIFLLVVFFLMSVSVVSAADPRLYFSPATGSYKVNDTFTVTMVVDSADQLVGAVDLVGTFDKSKLEIIKIEKASPMAFDVTGSAGDCSIDNATAWTNGNFSEICYSQTSVGDKVTTGNLVVVTFKAKAVGTATVNYTCTGQAGDSNITKITTVTDVIVCSANGSGSYTITEATGETSSTEVNNSSTTTTSTTTTTGTATELPQTGGIATTIGLIVFGAVSVLSALFLKFL